MTTDCADSLRVTVGEVDGAVLLTVHGLLDDTTYRKLRDAVIKAALDEPPAVIIDVTGLTVPAETAWVVFASARWHVNRWPEVPIALVAPDASVRETIARNRVPRHVPVYPAVNEAVDVTSAGHHRRRARAELPGGKPALSRSRDLVSEWLTAWSQPDLIPVAKVVVTSFVENVLEHTASRPGMRVETDGSSVTVAVEDHDRTPATLRESQAARDSPTGLRIVAALCRGWGNLPTPTGKIVWAVLGPENRL